MSSQAQRQLPGQEPAVPVGNAHVLGEDPSSTITFNASDAPYLLNLGISGKQHLEQPFSGSIENLTFVVGGGTGGRILYFCAHQRRIDLAHTFRVGTYSYSATSSGNDNAWVKDGPVNCIRENLTTGTIRFLPPEQTGEAKESGPWASTALS